MVNAQRYEVLHYLGDLAAREELQPGRLLGYDEIGRPYEVIDAAHEPCCENCNGWTEVQLQYATQEALKAEVARREAAGR